MSWQYQKPSLALGSCSQNNYLCEHLLLMNVRVTWVTVQYYSESAETIFAICMIHLSFVDKRIFLVSARNAGTLPGLKGGEQSGRYRCTAPNHKTIMELRARLFLCTHRGLHQPMVSPLYNVSLTISCRFEQNGPTEPQVRFQHRLRPLSM